MQNIHLNAGGVIGALVCGGVAGAIIFAKFDPEEAPVKFIIAALIGGAFAGNFLRELIFKKQQNPSQTSPAPDVQKLQ